jgi:hypothetical protein
MSIFGIFLHLYICTQRIFKNCMVICSRRLRIGGKQNTSLEKGKEKVSVEPAVPMVCRYVNCSVLYADSYAGSPDV